MNAWLDWWSGAFVSQIDEGWQMLPFFELDETLRGHGLCQNPPALLPLLEVTVISPEIPPDWLMSWLQQPNHGRQLALGLAQTIITPHCAPILPAPQLKIWCQRLHRALRPADWAGSEHCSGLQLLRRSLSAGCWQRVRLLFSPCLIASTEAITSAPLPTEKASLLWQAVLWQASRGEVEYVDNQTPDAG